MSLIKLRSTNGLNEYITKLSLTEVERQLDRSSSILTGQISTASHSRSARVSLSHILEDAWESVRQQSNLIEDWSVLGNVLVLRTLLRVAPFESFGS